MSVPKIDFNSGEIPYTLKPIKPKRQKKEKPQQEAKDIVKVPAQNDDLITSIKLLKSKIKEKRNEYKKECDEKGITKIKDELSALVKERFILMEQLF